MLSVLLAYPIVRRAIGAAVAMMLLDFAVVFTDVAAFAVSVLLLLLWMILLAQLLISILLLSKLMQHQQRQHHQQ